MPKTFKSFEEVKEHLDDLGYYTNAEKDGGYMSLVAMTNGLMPVFFQNIEDLLDYFEIRMEPGNDSIQTHVLPGGSDKQGT